MTIEIHEPELEQRIQQLICSGAYSSVEELLRWALNVTPAKDPLSSSATERESLGAFLRRSPLWRSGLEIERLKDEPRVPEL